MNVILPSKVAVKERSVDNSMKSWRGELSLRKKLQSQQAKGKGWMLGHVDETRHWGILQKINTWTNPHCMKGINRIMCRSMKRGT